MVTQPVGDGYPHHWEADVVLRDGATAHLRPIAASDADALQSFHQGQSEQSIYLRFFTYRSVLSEKELRRFTQVDYRDRVAFVITVAGAIIGVGRYDRLDDPKLAEVAFNISDAHQGRGLGSILLEHLAAAARENGVSRFTAEVLPENRKMLTVFAEAGYEVSRHFDDGVVSLSFDIDPTERSLAVMASREHRAEARSIEGLLSPTSIAVIGSGRPAEQLLEHLREGGFTGPIHTELDQSPQLAVIAVPKAEVLPVIERCGKAGVKGVLVVTSGFADDGETGLALQKELVRTAREHGMRLIGPASLGLVNTNASVSLNASLAAGMPRPGKLGLFSQSAAIGVALYASTARRGLGISSILSAGSRADVSGNDLMQYWEDDADTAVCAMYFESIGNPRKFSRLARRLARNKPVILAKSDALGLQLPPGHVVRTTQAPAGALDAMLRQSGIIRVKNIDQLANIAQIALSQALPAGPGLSVLSNSLALARVVADSASEAGLVVVETITDVGHQENPAQALAELREKLLLTLRRSDVDSAIATLMPARGLDVEALGVEPIAEVLAACAAETGKPVVAAFSGILDPQSPVEGLLATGNGDLPSFSSPGTAITALAALVRYSGWLRREQGSFEPPEGIESEAAQGFLDGLLEQVEGAELRTLSPTEAHQLLGYYGIPVLESVPFNSDQEAVQAAERLGWPVVLKSTDPALRQRLDLGGVRLNIQDSVTLKYEIAQMRGALAHTGEAALEVQAMAPLGQACALRAIEDPLLGPVVSFGLSGDAVNLLDDWAHRVPPLSSTDVSELVRAPRAAPKLFGYQGLPPIKISALEDLVARLALLKDEHPEIALIEFTPVLAGTEGCTVLSVKIQLGNAAQRTDSARRAMAS
ncbi:acyl-CoA synthetase (NDP forming)/RimJ/RimL family protein N-acetyltransferase [Psychromicrobium silvestre]|uniref:Acyl-CoA synthetase (NDP forming)/RimJ/RimL family protein N-acetyltransferase n=1 Tax=Psychromicrobium silvestre TaxID=1645614 RepID=A0A7Y9LR36_9MICC|nr:GNAT family N-acetyltransferase [Psychromicrobium silvestre]NYE94045.1 acyl-CoA synthetase (NDP forming)/RimJ/RimL family protein N-acetyltransferase [Psychromicrobium silvestre]